MDISIICPFYNEAEIIEEAIPKMYEQLSSLQRDWEFIVVNDGSTDISGEIVRKIANEFPNLHMIEYPLNRGRGYALRKGIAAAKGDIIITTEIDLSWGERIVHELDHALRNWLDTDIVVASPHLPGGGYRNVPFKRVFLSRFGNKIIRACMSKAATMNTGMTRAYRAECIKSLPLSEDGKEFHLEVILKATAFGFKIREIPATLEWKEYKHKGERIKRKSSSKVNRLIISHNLISVFANPVRYVWAMSLFSFIIGIVLFSIGLVLFYLNKVSIYAALLSLSLVILAVLLFVLGVILQQGNMIQRELWLLQRMDLYLKQNKKNSSAERNI